MSPGRAPGAEANVSAPSSKLAFNYNDEVLNVVKVLTNDAHGSGFYIDPKKRNVDETYVVTNYHVIEGYREVGVQFHPRAYSSSTKKIEGNQKVLVGKVISFDEVRDLALVQLLGAHEIAENAEGVIIHPNSEQITIGQETHAIGHPFGEDWTYTKGYVSQIRKQYGWSGELGKHHVADVIQTQTPINPGNSGGPLYDENGYVVGITTFGKSQPGAEGVNFAVHVREILPLFNQAQSKKIQPIDKKLASNLVHTADENKNGVADFYVWDDNQNSVADAWGHDKNEDNLIEKIYFDPNENRVPDVSGYLYHDISGKFSRSRGWIFIYEHDDNEDGVSDRTSIDLDLDGKIDTTY